MYRSDLYFVYGTLMRGQHNHEYFSMEEGTEFIGTDRVIGYRKYFSYGIPYVMYTGNNSDIVEGEVYRFIDRELEKRVVGMEVGAGYNMCDEYIDGVNDYGRLFVIVDSF